MNPSSTSAPAKVLIMAAGTGGHVFPALSIAQALRSHGVSIEWLGTPTGMENRLLEGEDIPLHRIDVKGVKGNGLVRLLFAPFMVARATLQAISVLRTTRPHCVLGMGGFICGPGGLAAKILGKPLVIHEQNAIAGTANRILSYIADLVLEAFPSTFKDANKVEHTGNPVREEIVELGKRELQKSDSKTAMKILVLGGSQGALAINRLVPSLLARWKECQPAMKLPELLHQAGRNKLEETLAGYTSAGIEIGAGHRVVEFVDDMAAAYSWADLVVCRSGASTVCEIAVVGVPAVFIPYPHHKDQQQTHNANWLAKQGAAYVVQQDSLDEADLLNKLLILDRDRDALLTMARKAREVAISDASQVIARKCLEVANAR